MTPDDSQPTTAPPATQPVPGTLGAPDVDGFDDQGEESEPGWFERNATLVISVSVAVIALAAALVSLFLYRESIDGANEDTEAGKAHRENEGGKPAGRDRLGAHVRLQPGELVDRVPRELTEQCRRQHQDRHENHRLGLPLQQSVIPPRKGRQPRDSFARGLQRESLHRGIWVDMGYEAEMRPASASGRRPQAKRCMYQPDSVATATP